MEKVKALAAPLAATTRAQMTVFIAEAKELTCRSTVRVEDAWTRYLPRADSRTSEGTRMNSTRHWRRFANWLAENHPKATELKHVTQDMAFEYAAHLETTYALSSSTFNQHRGAIRRVFDKLSKEAGLVENVWNQVPRRNSPGISRRELSKEELWHLLSKLDEEDFRIRDKDEVRVLFHIGAWTGLRFIDCCLLKWGSVDFAANTLRVVPAKTVRYGCGISIPMHPELRKRLNVAESWKRDEYVLPVTAARYKHKSCKLRFNVGKVFVKCGFDTNRKIEGRKKKAAIVGFHSLRHSFVSFCANAGVPLAVVQSIVGHSSPAITRHYTHISESSKIKAMEALPSFGGTDTGRTVQLPSKEKLTSLIKILQALESSGDIPSGDLLALGTVSNE